MLQSVSPMFKSDQNLENMGKNFLQSKKYYITRLVEQAGINVNMLKLNKNGAVKLDFYKMQSNLNQILLGQYIMKNGLNLNKEGTHFEIFPRNVFTCSNTCIAQTPWVKKQG